MKMIIITTTSSHKLSAACTMSNRQLTYIFYIYVIKTPTSKKINSDHTNIDPSRESHPRPQAQKWHTLPLRHRGNKD